MKGRVLMLLAGLLVATFIFSRRAVDLPVSLGSDSHEFGRPEPVRILGYSGDAMEPFISRDGKYLLFNNLNEPGVDTNLYFAERITDTEFRFKGEIQGANSPALDAVATMDRDNVMYFVSTRSYDKSFSTIYRGKFKQGKLTEVELTPGVSTETPGIVNFDVEVSPDGQTLCFVDGDFRSGSLKTSKFVIAIKRGSRFVRNPDSDRIMKNINPLGLVYAACISNDGLTLLFTLHVNGSSTPPQIFISKRKTVSSEFGIASRVAEADGFVEAPTLSGDERSLYFHKKVNGRFEIYRLTRKAARAHL